MRAVRLFPGEGPQLVDMPEPPAPSGTQVRVRVLQVGLCSVDRILLTSRGETQLAASHPLIIGHEMVGRAIQLGPQTRGVHLGDLVVATARRSCLVCESCRGGREDLCQTGLYRECGLRDADGFMAEYVLEEEANLVSAPIGLLEVAPLVEPLSLVAKTLGVARGYLAPLPPACGHRAHGWDQPQWGRCKRALVVGAGALGILTALWLRAAGAQVYVYGLSDPDPLSERLVGLSGAAHIAGEAVPLAALPRWVARADLVLETTGEPGLVTRLAQVLAPNGLMGLMIPESPGPLEALQGSGGGRWPLTPLNATVVGCAGAARQHFLEGVETLGRLVGGHSGVLGQLMAHRFPMEGFREALACAGPSSLKVMVDVARGSM